MLAQATHPMIFVGDGVAYSGAQEELTRLAELIGAEVWASDAGEVNIAYDHPLYMGQTGHMFGKSSHPILNKGDVNLVVGTYVLPEVYPELGGVFAPGAKVIHIDLNAYEIAKNHPVDLGVVADPRLTLAHLADAVQMGQSTLERKAAQSRSLKLARRTNRAAANRSRQTVPAATTCPCAPRVSWKSCRLRCPKMR